MNIMFLKPFHRAVGSHVKDPTNNIFTVDQSKQFNVSVKVIEIQLLHTGLIVNTQSVDIFKLFIQKRAR